MMGVRSISNALAQAADVVQLLKIKRDELVSVSVNGRSETCCHVDVKCFVRLFRLMNVKRDQLRTDLVGSGNLHARFTQLQTEFVTVVLADSEEFKSIEAAMASRATGLGGKQPLRIKGGQQLLLT